MPTLPPILREACLQKRPGTSWINTLAEHGLEQQICVIKGDSQPQLWLFGGSPLWWLDRPATKPAAYPLVGIMIDPRRQIRLFQLESVARITALQAISLNNAIGRCPAGARLRLGDIGQLTRPAAAAILTTVAASIYTELHALLTQSMPGAAGGDLTQLKSWVTRQTGDFVRRIEQLLDRDCLPDEPDLDRKYQAYNAFMRLPAEQRRLRVQAMSALPFLPGLEQAAGLSASIAQLIADRLPLIRHIAQTLSVPEWAVRALRDAYKLDGMVKVCPPTDDQVIVDLLLLIRSLDLNLLPVTAAGWAYLCHANERLPREWLMELQHFRFDLLASGQPLPKKMRAWKGRAGVNRQHALMRDYLDYAHTAGDPQFPAAGATDLFLQLFENATDWRQRAPQHVLDAYYNRHVPRWLQREIAPPAVAGQPFEHPHRSAESWPALLLAPRQIDCYTFTEVNTARGLDEEGAAMQHCVGSYAYRCAYNGTHILSVSDQERRLATIELTTHHTGKVELQQIRGPRNRRVDFDVTLAVTRFLDQINNKTKECPIVLLTSRGCMSDNFNEQEKFEMQSHRLSEALLRRGVLIDVEAETIFLSNNAFNGVSDSTDDRGTCLTDVEIANASLARIGCGVFVAGPSPERPHQLTVTDRCLTKEEETILFSELGIRGEVPRKDWQGSLSAFRRHPQTFKVPLAWLESHIALLVKAFSAVGCASWSSWQGHFEPIHQVFGDLHIDFKGPINTRWAHYLLQDAQTSSVRCDDLTIDIGVKRLLVTSRDTEQARDLVGSGRKQWLADIREQAIQVGVHLYRHRARLLDERLGWIDRHEAELVAIKE